MERLVVEPLPSFHLDHFDEIFQSSARSGAARLARIDKVWSPTCVMRPGLPAAISRVSCDRAPAVAYRLQLISRSHLGQGRSIDDGTAHDAFQEAW